MTQQKMYTDDWDAMDEVPETSGGFKNIGKLTLSTRFFVWKDGKTEEASRDEWVRLPARVDGKTAKGMDVTFVVDVQEFNPNLGFAYERRVTIGSIDWNKIVAPSIEAVMGKGAMSDANRGATMRSLNGKYVMVEDVPQIDTKNNTNRSKYNTVKFHKVYASREAAHAEFTALRGASGNANGVATNANVPADYTAETWASVKPDLVDAVSKAVNGVKAPPAKEAAKKAAIEKFASEYGASVEQVTALLNS